MVQSAKDGSIAFILDNYSGNDYFAIGARWGAGKKGGWCFSGSSTVETERGKIAIGDLRLGDNVLTLTPGTGAHYTEVIIFMALCKHPFDSKHPFSFLAGWTVTQMLMGGS